MKIIIVGASGRIGKEVDKILSDSHEIVRVGVTSGDVQCDYTDTESVHDMFSKIG
jgi:dTDP-4-dehydrorhamnose reductase